MTLRMFGCLALVATLGGAPAFAVEQPGAGKSEPAKTGETTGAKQAPEPKADAATAKNKPSTTTAAKPETTGAKTPAIGAKADAAPGTTARASMRPTARTAPERRPVAVRTATASPAAARTTRASAERDGMAVAAAQQRATPISGGIVCGAPAKFRCNARAPGFDKFYKFSKGHNWTDQTMATDFCASEKQMRVASTTRTLSAEAGCCGIAVVQVTCKR